jgi:hypothetical protein
MIKLGVGLALIGALVVALAVSTVAQLDPWLAWGSLGVGVGVALAALAATSPRYWGQHGQDGPRARQKGR